MQKIEHSVVLLIVLPIQAATATSTSVFIAVSYQVTVSHRIMLSAAKTAVQLGIKASAAGVAGGLGFGFYLHETDPGTRRAVKAYSKFAPVVLHYRWTELKDKISFAPKVTEEE